MCMYVFLFTVDTTIVSFCEECIETVCFWLSTILFYIIMLQVANHPVI